MTDSLSCDGTVTDKNPAEEEDADLAEALARGDPAAEDRFARRYLPRVQIMLLARTRNRDLTGDLAQETMLQALSALRRGQLREAEKLPNFVLGVARNILLRHFRDAVLEPIQEDSLEQVPAALKPDPLIEAEQQRIVARALATLDPVDRVILHMTLVEDLKPGVIAAKLRLSSDVVRQRKARATRRVIDLVRSLSQNRADGHLTTGRPL